jgi:hypothetical protein
VHERVGRSTRDAKLTTRFYVEKRAERREKKREKESPSGALPRNQLHGERDTTRVENAMPVHTRMWTGC